MFLIKWAVRFSNYPATDQINNFTSYRFLFWCLLFGLFYAISLEWLDIVLPQRESVSPAASRWGGWLRLLETGRSRLPVSCGLLPLGRLMTLCLCLPRRSAALKVTMEQFHPLKPLTSKDTPPGKRLHSLLHSPSLWTQWCDCPLMRFTAHLPTAFYQRNGRTHLCSRDGFMVSKQQSCRQPRNL